MAPFAALAAHLHGWGFRQSDDAGNDAFVSGALACTRSRLASLAEADRGPAGYV
jgi:hypothetical protein